MEITEVYPPIEKGKESVVDKRTILGIRFNFMTQPGQELWEKIDRYLDRVTPRDMKVPEPVLVAPNHRSHFDPHVAKRSVRGSLELYPADIPDVDLRKFLITVEPPKPVEQPKEQAFKEEMKAETQVFKCDECPKEFDSARAVRMHKMRGHIKEKVGA